MVKIGLTIPILSELYVCFFFFCRKQNFRERDKLQTWVATNIVINWQQCLNLIKETQRNDVLRTSVHEIPGTP